MAQSNINSTIVNQNLKPGDAMHKVSGDEIADSRVIDDYTFIMKTRSAIGHGYDLLHEDPLTGEQSRQWFSEDALSQLKSISF